MASMSIRRTPSSPGSAATTAISRAFRATRASPFAMFTRCATASGSSSGASRPRPPASSDNARSTIPVIASSSSACSVNTRQRDSSGALTSKDGFSVVAPMKVIVPSSTWGRMTSC